MDFSEATIKYRTFAYVIAMLIIVLGVFAYDKLGRLEDPEFTIKDALVVTYYPGATPSEVEEEVTERIETAIQELSYLDEIKSLSQAGISTITVTIKDQYDKHTLPQVWDELRHKIQDIQPGLPPGTLPSIVYDDYGDVYGVLIALSGNGFSYHDLQEYADFLRRELLQVEDVAKVITWGEQQEQIFVEISRSKLANSGLSLHDIYSTLKKQNIIVASGQVKIGRNYIRLQPAGGVNSVEDIRNLVIQTNNPAAKQAHIFYLKDIADVKRGYISPPGPHLRINGEPAIALGVSTVAGGNVVKMGRALKHKMVSLRNQTPLGMQLDSIYFQSDMVEKSVQSFVINLAEAIAIVIIVLMLFMGLRSGLLIGSVLLLTVCATLIVMNIYQINLQRISLGALIIALGMLVDNAIVVTEGVLVRIQQGMDRLQAAKEAVNSTMWPLLGATIIAVLAFAAIGLSQDSTGEYLRSLFQVMLISLGLSWVIAVTLTPLFCVDFLKFKKTTQKEAYSGLVFQGYKCFLKLCLRFRWITIVCVLSLLSLAIMAFMQLEDSFFPDSTSKQFFVHYWLPEGTDIRQTSADLNELEIFLSKQAGVETVSTFVGQGAPRFMLVYNPEKRYDSYGMLLITVDDYRKIDPLIQVIKQHISQHYLDANPKYEKVRLGPGGGYNLEVRFSGPDPTILRQLANQAKLIMSDDGGVVGVRDDWRERVKLIQPDIANDQARRAGITREAIADALQTTFGGLQVGLYRERDDLLPILSQPPLHERASVAEVYNVLVWSEQANQMVPLRQLVSGFTTHWEDANIHRRDKRRTITVQGDQKSGNASIVFERIKAPIEAIELPLGYTMEWGGEYENSTEAKEKLSSNLPLTLLFMVLVTIGLFNALRKPLIVWLTVPLAIIGVSLGLLVTNEPFGFMALLGFLSLSGMLIKNAIVLIDEIGLQMQSGKLAFDAVLDASISRMRPVTMAALTTILGMIPLLQDVFFKGMAVTIMAGLAFATLLTLLVVPVFYVIFYRIAYPESHDPTS